MKKTYKLIALDMDGTLYIGDRVFDFTPELLSTIKKAGKKYFLLKSVFCLPLSFYLKDYFFGTILIVLQSVVRIRSIYLKVSACPFGSYAACYLHFLIYALYT